MNVDKIKWMCGYAEGFDWRKDLINGEYLLTPEDIIYFKDLPDGLNYPLFLQRAIEGINSNIRKYDIRYIDNSIKIYDSENDMPMSDYWRFADIDQAKEVALTYIFEQESRE